MSFHRIPGSSRSIGPYGFMYKGGRTHIGKQIMSLNDFTPSPRSGRSSRSSSRRSGGRRSTRRR